MKHLDFWFDPVSPFAYLAFERLPQALEGLSYDVSYRPVLFAALLAHHGHKGPAEIDAKRVWTYRQVAWLAHRDGVELQLPAEHPFNPLPLLRLALACCAGGGTPNRYVVETLLHHVWRGGGAAADDPARLQALAATLAPRRDPQGNEVKLELRRSTDAAIAAGVFGVPTIAIDGELYWGFDALAMVAARLRGDPWFDGPPWADAAAPWPGVRRRG